LLKLAEDGIANADAEREKRELAALDKFLRLGRDRLSQEEKKLLREARDMGEAGYATGAATGGGILVPVDFNDMVTSAMKDYSPLLSLATIIQSPTGSPRPFPTDQDANSSGELQPENVQANLADVSQPGQVILTSFKFSSKEIRLSRELLQDQEVNLPEYLARILGVRLGRVISTYCTTGTGSGQPVGFMNSSTIVNAGTAAGTTGAEIAGADFALVESAVDAAYRPRAKWMCHPSTLQLLRGFVDLAGHPLYPGLSNSPDGIDRIMNREIVTNPAMDALQTGPSNPLTTVRPLALCDFTQYTVRMCPIILQRLDEKYAEFFQVAYVAYQRADGNFTTAGNCAAYLETTY